jgi:hypothetical protein
MSWATCESCGKEVHWRATRGSKLADLRCSCGGRLRAKTSGRPSGTRGRIMRLCAFCKAHRTSCETAEDWETPALHGSETGSAGVPVCRRCDCKVLARGSVSFVTPWGRPARRRLIKREKP